jgi:hypothetical protein
MTKPLQGKAFTKFCDIVMGMNTVSWSVWFGLAHVLD